MYVSKLIFVELEDNWRPKGMWCLTWVKPYTSDARWKTKGASSSDGTWSAACLMLVDVSSSCVGHEDDWVLWLNMPFDAHERLGSSGLMSVSLSGQTSALGSCDMYSGKGIAGRQPSGRQHRSWRCHYSVCLGPGKMMWMWVGWGGGISDMSPGGPC
jgi:hypothetical protein